MSVFTHSVQTVMGNTIQIRADFTNFILCDLRQNLGLLLGVSDDHAGCGDAFSPAGMGSDDTFNVFDDIGVDLDIHASRNGTQSLSGKHCRIATAIGSVQPMTGISSSLRIWMYASYFLQSMRLPFLFINIDILYYTTKIVASSPIEYSGHNPANSGLFSTEAVRPASKSRHWAIAQFLNSHKNILFLQNNCPSGPGILNKRRLTI